jgi:glycosyltransferase involved in cell wall biosynthesis
MRVLAHIHTLHEADIIAEAVAGLERQTRRPDALIIVDNGSTDGTLDKAFPDWVTIVRNPENVGVSGSIRNGITYAFEHGFDWIYILDADSTPEPKAIENLVQCYLSLSPELQASTWRLNSLPKDADTGFLHHGSMFTPRGVKMLNPPPRPSYIAAIPTSGAAAFIGWTR